MKVEGNDLTERDIATSRPLEWSQENYGPMAWDEAMQPENYCQEGGHTDWRLPTRAELVSLVDDQRIYPATQLPGMLSSDYWSSSNNAGNTDYAWYVNFLDGYVYYSTKTNTYYVRCVRGGQ